MLPENRAFWIRGEDGQEYGPVDLEELREWVRENRAGLGTSVRPDEPYAPWQLWQQCPELVALLAEVQVTGPVPNLAVAPMGKRVLAFTLDLILSYILVVPVIVVLMFAYMPDLVVNLAVASQLNPYSPPEISVKDEVILKLVYMAGVALYMAGFHALHARTPGKSALRLRVVDQSGGTPGFTKSLLRALALIFSMILYFFPVAYAFIDPQRRAFHDFVAGTYVVEA